MPPKKFINNKENGKMMTAKKSPVYLKMENSNPNPNFISTEFFVPSFDCAARIIGAKGVTIREIIESTDTKIISPTREMQSTKLAFVITGLPENVEKAIGELSNVVKSFYKLKQDEQASQGNIKNCLEF